MYRIGRRLSIHFCISSPWRYALRQDPAAEASAAIEAAAGAQPLQVLKMMAVSPTKWKFPNHFMGIEWDVTGYRSNNVIFVVVSKNFGMPPNAMKHFWFTKLYLANHGKPKNCENLCMRKQEEVGSWTWDWKDCHQDMGDVHKEPRCLSSGREKEKGLEKIFGLVSTKRMLELFEIQSQSVSFLMHPCMYIIVYIYTIRYTHLVIFI